MMKLVALVVLSVFSLGGCKSEVCDGATMAACPEKEPTSATVCAHLKGIECSAGVSPKCVDAVDYMRRTGRPPLRCWASAATKEDAEECGQVQCGR